VLRIVLSAVVTVWLAATLTFLLLRVLPGDALEAQLLQGGASRERITEVRDELGLNDALLIQYGRYIAALMRGDLGYSLGNGRSVNTIIAERLWPTLRLAGLALSMAITLGLIIGIVASTNHLPGRFAQMLIMLSISVPIYWSGTLVIIVFAAQLGWFPASGSVGWRALVLPVMVLSFHTLGEIARITQVNVRATQAMTFVQVARSKGLTQRIIWRRHTLRPALLPVISVIALQAGFLIGGTVITETLFVRSGIGRLLLDSTLNQDYPVVQGIVILSTLVYVSVNAFADVAYRFADPRLRD